METARVLLLKGSALSAADLNAVIAQAPLNVQDLHPKRSQSETGHENSKMGRQTPITGDENSQSDSWVRVHVFLR